MTADDETVWFGAEGPSPFDYIRAVIAIVVVIGFVILALPVQMVARRFKLKAARIIPMTFHRLVLWALGAKVVVRGELTTHRPTLIAANHCSWLDIMVLGSATPLSFVAKSEIAGWPLFGFLSKLQRTIFVDRERRISTAKTANEITGRMAEGDPVVLFAEGTSSDGNRVLKFRAALIGAAEMLARSTGETVWLQPVTIAYKRVNGLPAGRFHRHHVAWTGDMDLVPHAWPLLLKGAVDAEVIYGNPIPFDPAHARKAIAPLLESRVRAMLAASLTGKDEDLPPIVR
ncbi:MAG: lysophospholipid acyltransferase family protein [Alphaproteobacteria bacterium]